MAFDSFMQQDRFTCGLVWMLLTIATAGAVRADTVHLRNGNAIEGIVTRETETQVVLDLGTGSTTLPRFAVASIDHASAEENNRLQAGWKRRYFLHRQYVPKDLAGLASEFEKLGAARTEALRAYRTLGELSARETRLKTELEQLRAQIVQNSRGIQETQPGRTADVYNALIVSNNALQARWTTTNGELTNCQRESMAAEGHITGYLEAASAFGGLCAEARQKQSTNETTAVDRRQFFDHLAQAMVEYARDFSAVAVAFTPSNAGGIVTATVNDHVTGRFLVDTGAARVAVTESFAQRLQLDLSTLPEAEFIMADGHKTKGHTVVFHTMAVGDAHAENIDAGILPGNSGEQVDGLLGMSFLKHFAFSLDGGSGKLILRQFAPK